MEKTRYLSALCFCAALILFNPAVPAASAQSADWQGTFAPATGRGRLPGDALRVSLPADLGNETLQWLALELDNIDVTQLVSLDGMNAVVSPPRPLSPGDHTLRLVEYTRDGRMIDRGTWTFSVLNAVNYQFVSEISFNGSYRAASGDIPEEQFPPHRAVGDGGARVQGTAARDDWRISGTLDLLYSSEPPAELNEFEGGDFLIEAAKGPVTFDLGHHSLAPESLVMENFHRRGGSLSYRNTAESLAASGFAFRTEPVNGFRNGFGVSDENNRVTGGIVTARPLPGKGDLLSVSGIYLYGEQGTDPGVAVIDDQSAGEGNSWSLALESLLLGDKVRLRGEYAETRFDNDGSGTEEGKVSDDAFSLSAVYIPVMNREVRDTPLYWDVGAEYRQVGTFYHSIANPSLPSDLAMGRLYTTLSWSGLDLEAVVGREEDNVDDEPLLPTTRTDLIAVSGSYRLLAGAGEESQGRRWLGEPALTISAQQAWDKTDEVPADYGGGLVDLRTRDVLLSLSSSYASWDWYAGHTRGWQDDYSGQFSDTRTDVTDLSLNMRLGSRVTLGARGQRNKIREQATGVEFEGRLAGVDGSFIIVKDRVSATVSYQVDLQEASGGESDDKVQTTDFNVDWSVVRARGNRPGLSLWVRGQYQEVDDRTGFTNDTYPYQVFTGFTIGWPYSYPAAY